MTQSVRRLLDVREYLGLSLDDVARHARVSVFRLHQLEAGEEEPTEDELKALSGIYKFSPAYLMGRENLSEQPVKARPRASVKLSQKDQDELKLFSQFLMAAGTTD